MSDARLFYLVKDYMHTIRAAAGNDEFLELLADWITEHDA